MTRPSTRARIDWGAARAFFVAMDPPRTRAAVARRFGVSEAAVRQHATVEGWDELALTADQRAADKALAAAGRTREQRSAQILRIFDRAADLVDVALDPEKPQLEPEQVFAKFPELHRLYRLETEQATDNVALAEVQAGFRAAMRVAIETAGMVAGEIVAEVLAGTLAIEEMEAAFVRRFREVFLPAVNEALAIGPGE